MFLYILSSMLCMAGMVHAAATDAPGDTTITGKMFDDILRHEHRQGEIGTIVRTLNSSSDALQDAQRFAELATKTYNPHEDLELPYDKRKAREQLRQNFISNLTEIELLDPAGLTTQTEKARRLLDVDAHDPSFLPFVNAHVGKAGLAAYQALDSSVAYGETTKRAKGLEGKTFQEVQDGFKTLNFKPDGVTPVASVLRALRPAASLSYGILPWAHEISENRWTKKLIPGDHKNTRTTTPQSGLSKGVGAANILATLSSEIYNRANGSNMTLTPREAYLLSYLNRRKGVPLDMQNYKKNMSVLAKVRWVIRVVGLAALPALLSVFYRGKGKTTSPALLAGNIAGIADAIAGMYETYRTRLLIKKIKDIAPYIEQELERTPPTAQEKEADKAGDFSFDGDMGDMGAMFGGMQ